MLKPVGASITLFIADSSTMSCELLKSAFKRRPRFNVSGCATTIHAVNQLAAKHKVDVPLVSSHLADGRFSGLEAVQQLRLAQPQARCVLLIEEREDSLAVEAFRAGVKGIFCRSEQGFEALCKCIIRVHSGEIWASGKQLEAVMEAFTRTAPLRLVDARGSHLLSKREDEIVHLVAAGASNREIAQQLNLSPHTVKNYIFKIFEKLGLSSRVELALYAMHNRRETTPELPQKLAG